MNEKKQEKQEKQEKSDTQPEQQLSETSKQSNKQKKEKQPQLKKIHTFHNRSIFSISCFKKYILTTAMDRQIINFETQTSKIFWNVLSLAGFAYSVSFSSLDSTKLAIGVGDKSIRIWDMSTIVKQETNSKQQNQQGNIYDSTYLWKGIQSKVTVVSSFEIETNMSVHFFLFCFSWLGILKS